MLFCKNRGPGIDRSEIRHFPWSVPLKYGNFTANKHRHPCGSPDTNSTQSVRYIGKAVLSVISDSNFRKIWFEIVLKYKPMCAVPTLDAKFKSVSGMIFILFSRWSFRFWFLRWFLSGPNIWREDFFFFFLLKYCEIVFTFFLFAPNLWGKKVWESLWLCNGNLFRAVRPFNWKSSWVNRYVQWSTYINTNILNRRGCVVRIIKSNLFHPVSRRKAQNRFRPFEQ